MSPGGRASTCGRPPRAIMARGERPHEFRGAQRVPGEGGRTAMEEVHRTVPESTHSAVAG